MLVVPDFSVSKIDLAIVFSAMIAFLALIWASRRILFMLEISDFAISMSVKRDERIARAKRERGKIKNSFLKVSQSKEEKSRRKKLYIAKQKRYETKVQKEKIRAKNGRVLFAKKRLEVEQKTLEQRIPKAYSSKSSSSSKRTDRKEFMTQKYRETTFNNPLK